MNDMIRVAAGFQYSVNIAFDMHQNDKISNFIPTRAAVDFIKDIVESALPQSHRRARVLVGAYGRGKSHIVLNSLALLMKKDKALFNRLWHDEHAKSVQLEKLADNYYAKGVKILPVVISGSNTSITQAFILSLERTLQDNGLLDVMPDTNYQAAINCIYRWEKDYPEVYAKLIEEINYPVDEFINNLQSYDIAAYKLFEDVYPHLTAGSRFNPFLGFDVVELYESVVKAVRSRGYNGIYVVYDEFSKYLEANIKDANVSDTKMLQDFAEKCNRSEENQLHLLLICHKEIANYIDKLPKEKTDGWRGVSERFEHISLSNDYAQIYEVIGNVIEKDRNLWADYCLGHTELFAGLVRIYGKNNLFDDIEMNSLDDIFKACYPLHPVSLFVLPRLSEKIAQNERTLFTFLSSDERFTLSTFLKNNQIDSMMTPDFIYDYFQPIMQKELYEGEIYKQYMLIENILRNIGAESIEAKLIKALGLIYMIGEFERLMPTFDTLLRMYEGVYSTEDIELAIRALLENNYFLYLRRNNGFLCLKEASGVDIRKNIQERIANQAYEFTEKDILNSLNFNNYLYPARYNDEYEMTRYFRFEFIEGSEVKADTDWEQKSKSLKADGVIYGILPESENEFAELRQIISECQGERIIFALPKNYKNMQEIVRELSAVQSLRDEAEQDKVLFHEYDVIYDDVYEIVNSYIRGFMRPDEYQTDYFYAGKKQNIIRKSQLSTLMSDIMEQVFSDTPIINNEVINKDDVTTIVVNSRGRVIAGLLRSELEESLGLKGSGQDVAIMRSTLLRTGVLVQDEHAGILKLNFTPGEYGLDIRLGSVLARIRDFFLSCEPGKGKSFGELYKILESPAYHIGMRRGLIPIYLAVMMHNYKKNIIVYSQYGEVSINADLLQQINSYPDGFRVERIIWNASREEYIAKLKAEFAAYMKETGVYDEGYNQVYEAMRAWYRSLPGYSRNLKQLRENDSMVGKKFLNILKKDSSATDVLFYKIPKIFGIEDNYSRLSEMIADVKNEYDEAIDSLISTLTSSLKQLFAKKDTSAQISLLSVFQDWYEDLEAGIEEYSFLDNTGDFLQIIKGATNDEHELVNKLARLATGLRLNDWTLDTVDLFETNICQYKQTAEAYEGIRINDDEEINADSLEGNSDEYVVRFVDESGNSTIKRFQRVETSPRSRRLYNSLLARIEETGQALSMAEKRQIIMKILQDMC